MTKVTYYMYSCDTCYKIREMMEMDGLDSAKCKNLEERTHWEFMELLMIMGQKMNIVHLLQRDQNVKDDAVGAVIHF